MRCASCRPAGAEEVLEIIDEHTVPGPVGDGLRALWTAAASRGDGDDELAEVLAGEEHVQGLRCPVEAVDHVLVGPRRLEPFVVTPDGSQTA